MHRIVYLGAYICLLGACSPIWADSSGQQLGCLEDDTLSLADPRVVSVGQVAHVTCYSQSSTRTAHEQYVLRFDPATVPGLNLQDAALFTQVRHKGESVYDGFTPWQSRHEVVGQFELRGVAYDVWVNLHKQPSNNLVLTNFDSVEGTPFPHVVVVSFPEPMHWSPDWATWEIRHVYVNVTTRGTRLKLTLSYDRATAAIRIEELPLHLEDMLTVYRASLRTDGYK